MTRPIHTYLTPREWLALAVALTAMDALLLSGWIGRIAGVVAVVVGAI